MERSIEDKTILDVFVEDFARVVEHHCMYVIVSGFIAIAHGRSRGTEDIDMIIEKLDKESFISLHEDLLHHGFVCVQSDDPLKLFTLYLQAGMSIRYTRGPEFFPPEMEVKFVKDVLDEATLRERTKLPLSGLDVWFARIETAIAFKEELLKTDKDMEDARHLRIIYKESLSPAVIEHTKQEIQRVRL
jgi:hypothetical protein